MAQCDYGEEVPALSEEEEEVESGSTSDEEEQEDPRDYCKGSPLSHVTLATPPINHFIV